MKKFIIIFLLITTSSWAALDKDGFETNDLTGWTGHTETGTGSTNTVDATIKNSGGYAGKSFTTNDEAVAQLELDLSGYTAGEIYVRWYMYIPTIDLIAGQNIYFLSLGDSSAGEILNAQIDDPDELVELHSDITSTSDFSASAYPFDQQVCMELHVIIHASAGTLALKQNGVEICSITGEDTLNLAATVGELHLGILFSDDITADVSVYIDDVVVDTQPIGCKRRSF